MVQRHSRTRLAIVVASLFLAMGRLAHAQGLPSLTVTALSLATDRTSAPAGRAFHVTVHAHVMQHVNVLHEWLVLPNLDNLTILGDEKRTTPTASNGTDYVEILTVAGIAPGDASLSPAYIDARDPSRGGKPFRFSSNSLHVRITSEVAEPAVDPGRTYGRTIMRVVAGIVLVAIAFFIVRALRRRPRVEAPVPPAQRVTLVPTPLPAVDGLALIREAEAGLAAGRTRAHAAALRAALLGYAGARTDETLSSLLARMPVDASTLRAALRSAERATFVDEEHLQGAIDDLLDAVARMNLR